MPVWSSGYAARIYALPSPPAPARRRAHTDARGRAGALRATSRAVVAHEAAAPLNFAELSAALTASVQDAVGDALPAGVPADLADDLARLAGNLARILAPRLHAASVVRSAADARDGDRA